MKEQIELFGSFGYDSAAVPASTLEPTLQDYHSFAPSIGAKFGIGKHFEIATSYTHFFYVPRDTTGESVLATLEALRGRPTPAASTPRRSASSTSTRSSPYPR